ncbi:MAG: glycosyltransferase [Anaerolineales bacterium]|nr:glycosyltransferase [Anaerolineales bacterium]
MPDAEQAALVILNYNGRALLPDCLAAALAQSVPAAVVVADNGSSDGSPAWLRAEYPNVRVLDLGRNWGFAAGYNRALAEVDYPWLALVNNDAELAPDWLERLLAFAAARPQAAILGGKLRLAQPGQTRLQSAGGKFTTAGTAFEMGWGAPDTGQFDTPGPVGVIPGAAMLIRREAWAALGGFDPDYGAYLEDVDLCWRAWLAGYEVHYRPEAVARHHYGATAGGRLSPYRVRAMQRNRLANMVKNLQARSLPGGLLVSLTYDAYRVLEYGRRGQWANLRALAGGTAAFGRGLAALLARRGPVQAGRVLSDADLRRRGLLAGALEAFWEYRRIGQLSP